MPRSFYIIDGHAHIYRSYFAPFRELTSPTGEPTKATFVFTQMLLNLIEQRRPDYLAVVIDTGDDGTDEGVPVFRKAFFPEYKANRAKRPDDFGPQEKRILDLVRDAGVPIFAKAGFEADDLLATMAEQLKDQDFEVFLVSKDKDLRQVVGPNVKMYDVQADEVIDAAALEARLGYGPAEAVEVQTLIGDATDNVPGIPGVGEKTAAKLIKKYGSADAVLAHVDELTPKMRENFKAHGDRMAMARRLVTLDRHVQFDWSVEACKYAGLNADGLRKHLQELNFTNLLRRTEAGGVLAGGNGGGASAGPASAATAKPAAKAKGKSKSAGDAAGSAAEAAEDNGAGTLFGPPDSDAPPTTGVEADGITPISHLKTSVGLPYEVVDTPEKLAAFVAELRKQKRFAFDTETDA
ncbi:MAG: polymerase, partial [Phycisphaerales bacterium]|nr:polymerase [Phycisphaerales bacterium]